MTRPKWGPSTLFYSWGVLHHTGDLWRAIKHAAAMVRSGGTLIIALYLKTPFCGFWKLEKRFYSSLPRWFQLPILYAFYFVRILRILLGGKNPIRYIREYNQSRGMNFLNDCHDWIGGYPYESTTPAEVTSIMSNLGFDVVKLPQDKPPFGLFGSSCAEYLFRKRGNG